MARTNTQFTNSSESIDESAARPPTEGGIKRMTISLSEDTANMLKHLADSQAITQNEVIRRALASEFYLKKEQESGSTILVQKSNKEIREVVFR
jgi:hypothetical protein